MSGKVILGFSGGIDSTVSAQILRAQGYDILLETIDTIGESRFIADAETSARRLGLPLHVAHATASFKTCVIDYFIHSYLKGETPAPCTVCNTAIKWKTLYERMRAERADHIATGHYFRLKAENGRLYVRTARDPRKDQSYYLWDLPQHYLARALSPMGDRIKEEVKIQYADTVPGRESMGVCFLQGGRYTDFLRDRVPEIRPGDVVDRHGHTVGQHDGYALYTIGQKKGYRCILPGSVVTGIDAATNRLIVGQDRDLYYHNLIVGRHRITDPDRLLGSKKITIKIRGLGRNPELPVTVGYARNGEKSPHDSGEIPSLQIFTSDPAWAPAKGQPVVFYEDDMVVGGGYLLDYF